MDALTIPAAGGKDTSAIILGDYSNGNDAVLLKGASETSAIKGRDVYLVELSVSHYLLARALETNGLAMTDVKTMNTSDADIAGGPSPRRQITAAVAWNPQVTTMKDVAGTTAVFTSADIPGEILDLLVVDTATLKANPDLGKALAGIWYENHGADGRKTMPRAPPRARSMAKLAGTTPEAFEGQLATTFLYTDPQGGGWRRWPRRISVTTMTRVRDFSFDQGLFGQGARFCRCGGHGISGRYTRLGDEGNNHVAVPIPPSCSWQRTGSFEGARGRIAGRWPDALGEPHDRARQCTAAGRTPAGGAGADLCHRCREPPRRQPCPTRSCLCRPRWSRRWRRWCSRPIRCRANICSGPIRWPA